MRKTFQYFFLALVLIALAQINALACKCEGEPDFNKMFAESSAVIKGEAVIVENFGLEIFALIKIEKSWKGIKEDKVIIKTDTGSCGVEFEVGETYNLWVDKLDKSFVTMPCRDYEEKQIAFLQDKPTLELKSSNPDFDSDFSNSNNKSENNQETFSESNKIQTEKESRNEGTNLVLIFAVSVTAIVFIVMSIIIGFLFWRNRKR